MPEPAPTRPPLRFALTIVDGRAVLAGTAAIAEGAAPDFGHVERLSLEVPGLRFPFDLSLGPRAFQSRRCRLREFVYVVTPAEIEAVLNAAGLERYGLDQIAVRLGSGGLRLALRARIGEEEAELTCRVAFEGLAGGVWRVALRDTRLHGTLPVPAPLLLAALPAALGLAPETVTTQPHRAMVPPPLIQPRGVTEWDVDVVTLALLDELVTAGFRLPARAGLRAAPVELSDGRLLFRLVSEGEEASHAAPDEAGVQDRGLAALAEVAFCAGEVRAAAEGFRRALDAEPNNLFARERLLQLLASFPEARLDLEALAEEHLSQHAAGEAGLALVAKAVAALADERETEAAWLYARVAAAAAANGEPLEEAAARLAAASVFFKSGDEEAALTAVERVLALRPAHAGALALRDRLQASPRGQHVEGPA
ncbi:MAG TPA: hypothetical protein VGG33_03625 [Polyangia bacterium]